MQEKDWVQFWSAREIAPLFGYKEWRHFKVLIEKTKETLQSLGEQVWTYIVAVDKVQTLPSWWEWKIPEYDFLLTRYACYLTAQNGNPTKKEIAQCKQYFAIQTRTAEIAQERERDKLRVQTRLDVTDQTKKLNATAQGCGVVNFGSFTDEWYRWLYGMRYAEIKKHKNLGDDALLDRADITELAANLFRITQTDERLKRSGSKTQKESEEIHFMIGGKVRQTIKDIGWTPPEHLPLAPDHIKEVKKRLKKNEKNLPNKKSALPS